MEEKIFENIGELADGTATEAVIEEGDSATNDQPEFPEKSEETSESVVNKDVENEPDGNAEKDDSKFRNLEEIIIAFAKGRGIPDDVRDNVFMKIMEINKSLDSGNVATDVFEIIRKGLAYDDDVSKAAADGELKGRNAKIEEIYFEDATTDGLPHFTTPHTMAPDIKAASIFDLAREA